MGNTVTELTPEQLRRECDSASFDFRSTADLPPLAVVVGQERAVRALGFGIDIQSPGYHLYALGPAGTGKMTTINELLERRAVTGPRADDWCYVNNFEDQEEPRAVHLPAGEGPRLRHDMDELISTLEVEVPDAFENEQYQRETQKVQTDLRERQESVVEAILKEAAAKEFKLLRSKQGIIAIPMVDGEVVPPEKVSDLDDEVRGRLEKEWVVVQERIRETNHTMLSLQKEARAKLRELDRQLVFATVEVPITNLKEKYRKTPGVVVFLDEVLHDIVRQVQEYTQAQRPGGDDPKEAGNGSNGGPQGPDPERYRVNVIIDNGRLRGAPVVVERNPTPRNLIGRIEHESKMGTLVTDFSMIRPGAFHRANGGYLLLEARDVLLRQYAWGVLKRLLKDKLIRIESMVDEHRISTSRTLKPEPIPLDVKVVMVGDQDLFSLLYGLDPEFRELFKVKADFNVETAWDGDTQDKYARFIGDLCRTEGLTHFDPTGVARVVEHAARIVSNQGKVSTRFGDLVDLIREASYWAATDGHDLVRADDVQLAIDEKIYRSNRIEERVRELIADRTILIDSRGEAVGQVNGLSVSSIGDHAFGRPARITARTHVGAEGVVNIDRETKLGGRIHNKGVMIITGFLGARYAHDVPLALSASITFEQLYNDVEGDSASSTELYALMSSLSGIPIRQDVAVTGSVNQYGRVQAIGGVNEKIEGFFDVCRMDDLTGAQGVMIPASNVSNLMLRHDVVKAVREGRFHVWAVETIDQGIEILTGRPAGDLQDDGTYPAGTVNRAVQDKLCELAEKGRRYTHAGKLSRDS